MAKKKVEETEKKSVKKEEKINLDDIKKELSIYIDETIKKSMTLELEKSYKRTIREKNIKIIIKNMVITILLLVIVYLVYILNDNDYFDKFFIEDNNKQKSFEVIDKKTNKDEVVEEEKEPTLEELKAEYGYLLNNIYINEDAVYVDDYYNGKLTNELKHYLAMNLIDVNSLSKEEDYNVIENDILKKCYEKKFIGEYSNQNFNYNGNTFRYINKLDAYITDNVVKENNTNIKRIITDVTIDGDDVIIATIEGLVKENKLYNILTDEEISEYSDELMLANAERLNKMVYTFDKDGKLIKINN